MVARRLGALMMAGALPGLVIASMFVDWRVGGGDYSAVGYAAFALGALLSSSTSTCRSSIPTCFERRRATTRSPDTCRDFRS
jgi:hypothetical protein